MKFAYTILYVDDVPSSLAFYEAAFGLQQKMLHESGDYGELETGNTTIAMASKELMPGQSEAGAGVAAAGASSRFFEIAFTTDAVEVAKPWGQIVAYVHDTNGVLVEICTPMS